MEVLKLVEDIKNTLTDLNLEDPNLIPVLKNFLKDIQKFILPTGERLFPINQIKKIAESENDKKLKRDDFVILNEKTKQIKSLITSFGKEKEVINKIKNVTLEEEIGKLEISDSSKKSNSEIKTRDELNFSDGKLNNSNFVKTQDYKSFEEKKDELNFSDGKLNISNSFIKTRDGKSFEEKFFNFLIGNYKNFEIVNKASIAHYADIHVTDHINKNIFIFELKNKASVSKQDIDKFTKDLMGFDSGNYKKIGIFISAVSSIPIYGEVGFSESKGWKEFYLSGKYIKKEVFDILFCHINYNSNIEGSKELIDFTPELSENLADLKQEYENIVEEVETINEIEKSNKIIIQKTALLRAQSYRRELFIKKIFKSLDLDLKNINTSLNMSPLFETVNTNRGITKKDLLEKFPSYKFYINSKTKNDILLDASNANMAKIKKMIN